MTDEDIELNTEEVEWDEEEVDWEEFDHDGDMLYVDDRNQTRHQVRVDVDIRTSEGDYSGHLGDISRGGMFISTENFRPDEGESFAFRFELPGESRAVRGRAEVRWRKQPGDGSESPGFGAQFLAMAKRDIEIIDSYLETQAALEEALLAD